MVDGAFAELARSAVEGLAEDAREGAGRPGGDMIRRAEDGDAGDAEGAGDVHRAGVVGEKGGAGGGDGDELIELRFARKIVVCDARGVEQSLDLLAEFAFVSRAEYGHAGAGLAGDFGGGFGEALWQPALGGAEGGAGADADPLAVEVQFAEEFAALFGEEGDAGEANGVDVRDSVDEASAAEEFEVVIPLVFRDFAGFGRGDGVGQEQAAAVAGVADAGGDAGGPDDGGGVEGVGQEDGAVEVEFAEFLGQTPFGGEILRATGEVVGDDVIDERTVIEAGDPRAGQ